IGARRHGRESPGAMIRRTRGHTMQRRTMLIAWAAAVLAPRTSFAGPTASPPGAEVYIIWPYDGAVIKGGFWVRMGLRNMGLCPKGIDRPNVGHHHLLIDTDLPPMDQPI